MKHLTVLLIHGIGEHDRHWADETIRSLYERIEKKLKALAPATRTADARSSIRIESFEWDSLFYERQMILYNLLNTRSKARVLPAIAGAAINPIVWLGNAAASAFSAYFLAKIRPLQTKVISQFIGDILAYRDPKAQKLVHKHFESRLAAIAPAGASEKTPLTLIAHSLGTVIASNFIYDRTRGGAAFDAHFRLENLFTCGSPLALFSLQYGDDPEAFSSPVRVETPQGRWLNLFDDDDPVAAPLKGLNASYAAAVHEDIQVDAGIYGASHVGYFNKPEALDLMAHKIAIDWLRHSGAIDAARYAQLLDACDGNPANPRVITVTERPRAID